MTTGDPKNTCAGNWWAGVEAWTGVTKTPVGYLVANPRKLPIIPPLPPGEENGPHPEPNAPIAICPLKPIASLAATAGRGRQ